MISSLTGIVEAIGANWAVVNVGGVGLRVLCTPATAATLRTGGEARLATSLVVREDSLTLFGFAETDERDSFELVQTATGVGPKLAQAIMSVLSPAELRSAIASANLALLCKVPGVGRKSAERLVLELKDKVGALAAISSGPVSGTPDQPLWREQVRAGLEGLGWSSRDADAACDKVAAMADESPTPSVATLMRAALRTLAK
jgi:Holliday junction DNA helicase RuvA